MTGSPQESEIIVIGIGEYAVSRSHMSTIGLGSCVGVMLYDRERAIGALAHVMLPDSGGKTDRPGKYADTAVEILIVEMKRKGCNINGLTAKIAGGSAMFKSFSGTLNVGERNVEVIKRLLKKNNIPIKAEDVAGSVGRSIYFYPAENAKVVIRKGDGTIVEL
jgi:chemotaxis protein CheD